MREALEAWRAVDGRFDELAFRRSLNAGETGGGRPLGSSGGAGWSPAGWSASGFNSVPVPDAHPRR